MLELYYIQNIEYWSLFLTETPNITINRGTFNVRTMQTISVGCYFAINLKPQNTALIIRKCDKIQIRMKLIPT